MPAPTDHRGIAKRRGGHEESKQRDHLATLCLRERLWSSGVCVCVCVEGRSVLAHHVRVDDFLTFGASEMFL